MAKQPPQLGGLQLCAVSVWNRFQSLKEEEEEEKEEERQEKEEELQVRREPS